MQYSSLQELFYVPGFQKVDKLSSLYVSPEPGGISGQLAGGQLESVSWAEIMQMHGYFIKFMEM